MMLALFLFTAVAADTATGVTIRDGCGEDAAIVATVPASESFAVHHGVAGEALACYAVSAMRSGVEVRGYVVGNSLPAVQEFERRRALESRIPIPVMPPAAPGEKKAGDRTISPEDAGPLAGRQFKPWNGIDWEGKAVSIRPGDAKVTLVAFFRPQSRAARLQLVDLSFLVSKFGNQGLKSVGFIEGASVADTKSYLEELSVTIPLAVDRSSVVSEFGAEAAKGTTLVLDESGKVVASSSDPKKIRDIVNKLLAP